MEKEAAEYKKRKVAEIVKLLKEYPITGVVDMENMPASALQTMRAKLRKDVVLLMTKKRLMKIALTEAKIPGTEKLNDHFKGMPAMLFTKTNPFKLYKTINQNKSPAPAKAGQKAPKDIVIPAGPTQFTPGPIIGELGMFGIKTSVEGGKIAIQQDKVIVKEGEEIKEKVAGLLARFGIQPMELGLDLVAVCEKGVIYDKKVLHIDEKKFMQDLTNAAAWAINLSVEAGYFTTDTIKILIPKAFREAKQVAIEGNIMCDLLAEELVEKAERQMISLKTEANIQDIAAAPKEETKPAEETTKKEPKPEAQKEEKAKEKPAETKKEEKPKAEEAPKEKKVEEKPAEPKVEKQTTPTERTITEEAKKEAAEGENLFEELKKKGTLRGIEKEKPKGKPSPEDIIRNAHS